MHKTKAIKLLKSLNAVELKRLNKFLRSPYYHNNPHINNMYHTVRLYAPAYESSKLQRELVYEKLFPGEKIDLNKFRKLLTAFTQILEEYLILLELEEREIQKKMLLKSALGRRNVFDLFEKQTFDLVRELESGFHKNQIYYRNLLDLYEEYYFHSSSKKTDVKFNPIGLAMDQLDHYFMFAKLKLGTEMRARENLLKENYDIRFLDAVLDERQTSFQQSPVLKLYAEVLDLHSGDYSFEQFIRLKNQFEQSLGLIAFSENRSIFYHLLNFVVRQVNSGNPQYVKELLSFYKIGLENQFVIENGRMTAATFINIASTASSLGQHDWSYQFIQKYASFLEEEMRADIKAISLASWYFNQKDYDSVIQLLINHHFNEINRHLLSRAQLIRCYFELYLQKEQNFDFLQDQINAFEKFLRRQKKIELQKKNAILNFALYARKISLSRYKKDQLDLLKDKLLKEGRITYRKWLLEKIERL